MAGRKPSNLFYRIETADGRGPYRGRESHITGSAFTARHNCWDGRPTPGIDNTFKSHWMRGDAEEHKFGFKTETQLRRWFTPPVLKTMAKNAAEIGQTFFVSVYRGECLAGERQAMAKLERMELVSRTPLAKYAAGEKLIKRGKMDIAPPAPSPSEHACAAPKINPSYFSSVVDYDQIISRASREWVNYMLNTNGI